MTVDPLTYPGTGPLIADQIRRRFPSSFAEQTDEPGHWRFTNTESNDDPHWRCYVEVDARDRLALVLTPEMEGKHMGPSVTAYNAGLQLLVTLPEVHDATDVDAAVRAAGEICGVTVRNRGES